MATTSIGAPGVTFPDATVQATAGGSNVNLVTVGTSPGTWTKPASVKSIKVTVVGGGGSGGASVTPNASASLGGGGGGGAAIRFYPAASIPGPQPYTVGGTGATSSFGVSPITVISATGGATAASQTPGQTMSTAGGLGGAGSNGNLNMTGQDGGTPIYGVFAGGGIGGSSILGGGGSSPTSPGGGAGNNGGAYGGGGGGSAHLVNSGSVGSGGVGAAGVVIIEEFY
jgi:hypothetical protein